MSGALTRRYVDHRNSAKYKASRTKMLFEEHEMQALTKILALDNDMQNLGESLSLVPPVFQHMDNEEYSEAAKSLKAKHPLSWDHRHRKHQRRNNGSITLASNETALHTGSIFVRVFNLIKSLNRRASGTDNK